MQPIVLAVASIAISVAAQFSLKWGMGSASVQQATASGWSLQSAWVLLTQPSILAGFALYGLGAVIWLSVLSAWDVSKAYPLVGLGFVLSTLIGYLIGEQVTPLRLAGVLLICAGVGVVARS